jgi:hypothetical protein
MREGEPTLTLTELIDFIRVCEAQVGTEGYSKPRFRAVLGILEALDTVNRAEAEESSL